MIKADPVGSLFRGRNVSQEAKEKLRAEFGLDKSSGRAVHRSTSSRPRRGTSASRTSTRLNRSRRRSGTRSGRPSCSSARRRSSRRCSGCFAGHPGRRGEAQQRVRPRVDRRLDVHVRDARTSTSGSCCSRCSRSGWRGYPPEAWRTPVAEASSTTLKHLILPCATLTIAYFGEYTIIMRSSLLEVLGEDYLITARAKGVRDILVRRRHAVPNAILPVITLFALNLGFVLSGAIAVELVFSWPGLGPSDRGRVEGPRLPDAAGPLPALQRGDHLHQPRHRPRLRLPRPESEHAVTDPTGGAFESARDSALAEAWPRCPGGERPGAHLESPAQERGSRVAGVLGQRPGQGRADHPRCSSS